MTLLILLRTFSISTFLLCSFSFSGFAQITPSDLKGCYHKRYEMNLDTLLNSVDLNFCLNDNLQFALTVAIDEMPFHYYGTYSIQADTILFHMDGTFQEFLFSTRNNSKIKKKQTRISFYSPEQTGYGVSLLLMSKDSSTYSTYAIHEFEFNDKESVYQKSLELPDPVIVQLTDAFGSRSTYEYHLTGPDNDVYIFPNLENAFRAELFALKTETGIIVAETKYKKNITRADTLTYTTFDPAMFEDTRESRIPAGYQQLAATNIYLRSSTPEEYSYDTTSYSDYNADYLYGEEPFANDTLVFFHDFATAKKMATDSGRYLILYYEPQPCITCGAFSLDNSIKLLHNNYLYPQIAMVHAEKSVFYFAHARDSIRFKNYGIHQFPATVVLSANGKVLYTEQGPDLHFLRAAYNSTYNNEFFTKLDLHETFHDLPQEIIANNYDSALIFSYLNKIRLSGIYSDNTGEDYPWYEDYADYQKEADATAPIVDYTDDLQNYQDEDDNFADTLSVENSIITLDIIRSALQLNMDISFAESIIDSLITRYYAHSLPDSVGTKKLLEALYLFDDHFRPFRKEENTFITSTTFQYLIDHYSSLKPYSFQLSTYGNPVTVYEIISKQLNKLTKTAAEGMDVTQFQLMVIEQLPSIKPFEMPLYISNLILLYDSFPNQKLEEAPVVYYLNQIGAIPEKAIFKTDSIQNAINENYLTEELLYDYSINYYYRLGGSYRYSTDEWPEKTYHRYKHAEILNSTAWHYYKHISDHDKLTMALQWSKSSVALEPLNPYFLDTYAHLLYKLGKTKDALKIQKKAIAAMDSNELLYDIDYTQRETIKEDYHKMKKKSL